MIDLTGKRFGRLVVASEAGSRIRSYPGRANHRERLFLCKCDCGGESIASMRNLSSGNTNSCGCLRRIVQSLNATTHGETIGGATPEYTAWKCMRERCTNPRHEDFKSYMGRGIRVCDRWLNSYENFIADMGRKPTPGHSLDRKDVNGHYEPENCRWGSEEEQKNNKTNSRMVVVDGQAMTLAQACRTTGVKYMKAFRRLQRGKPIEQALAP